MSFYKDINRIQISLESVMAFDQMCKKDTQNRQHFETGGK